MSFYSVRFSLCGSFTEALRQPRAPMVAGCCFLVLFQGNGFLSSSCMRGLWCASCHTHSGAKSDCARRCRCLYLDQCGVVGDAGGGAKPSQTRPGSKGHGSGGRKCHRSEACSWSVGVGGGCQKSEQAERCRMSCASTRRGFAGSRRRSLGIEICSVCLSLEQSQDASRVPLPHS